MGRSVPESLTLLRSSSLARDWLLLLALATHTRRSLSLFTIWHCSWQARPGLNTSPATHQHNLSGTRELPFSLAGPRGWRTCLGGNKISCQLSFLTNKTQPCTPSLHPTANSFNPQLSPCSHHPPGKQVGLEITGFSGHTFTCSHTLFTLKVY